MKTSYVVVVGGFGDGEGSYGWRPYSARFVTRRAAEEAMKFWSNSHYGRAEIIEDFLEE